MPHLLLEYSANVDGVPHLPDFFADLHRAIGRAEPAVAADLKSRATCHEAYLVGDGSTGKDAFVALTFKLLGGRDVSVRQRLVQVAAEAIARHFVTARAGGRCQVSVEVCEMERSTYTKQWYLGAEPPEGT